MEGSGSQKGDTADTSRHKPLITLSSHGQQVTQMCPTSQGGLMPRLKLGLGQIQHRGALCRCCSTGFACTLTSAGPPACASSRAVFCAIIRSRCCLSLMDSFTGNGAYSLGER